MWAIGSIKEDYLGYGFLVPRFAQSFSNSSTGVFRIDASRHDQIYFQEIFISFNRLGVARKEAK